MRPAGEILGLALLASQAVVAWKHAEETALRQAIESNSGGYTLVASFTVHTPVFFEAYIAANPFGRQLSQSIEPEWMSVQRTEQNALSFDCGANLKACKDLDAVSYPAIRLYHPDGSIDRYRGQRNANSIATFLRRIQRPAVGAVDESRSFLLSDDFVFVAQFLPEDTSYEQGFRSLAKHYRDRYSFGIAEPATETSSIKCRNNVDEEEYTTTELWRVETFEDFLRLCTRPLVPEITKKNEEYYAQTGKSIVHFFATTEKEKEQYRTEIRELAKGYRDFVLFAVIDANKSPEMLSALGLKEGSKTGLSLKDLEGVIFPYTGRKKITGEVVAAFLNDVIEGKIKPADGGDPLNQAIRHEEL